MTKKLPFGIRKPMPKVRLAPRRSEGRVAHERIKPKAVSAPSVDEARHLRRVAEHGCLLCGRTAVVHHVMKCPDKQRRRDDRFVAPLCPEHHNMGNDSVHLLGSEAAFERVHGIDLALWAVTAWQASQGGIALGE